MWFSVYKPDAALASLHAEGALLQIHVLTGF